MLLILETIQREGEKNEIMTVITIQDSTKKPTLRLYTKLDVDTGELKREKY